MSKQPKKRNKKYVPKIKAFPLGMRNEHQFEIPFLTALDTLGTEHFDAMMLSKLAEYGYLAAELNAPDEFNPYAEAIQAMFDRFEKTGRAGATGDEMRVIREIAPKLMNFMRGRTNYEIVRAGTILITKLRKSNAYWTQQQDPNNPPPNMPPKEDGSDSYVPYGDH